jgi:spore germination cell wall hydrolase CwlJ-like protein
MKKFVILFLLLIPFASHAQTSTTPAAEITRVQIEAPQIEITAPDINIEVASLTPKVEAETFAVDITSAEVIARPLPTEEDIRCMQQNLYFEARNEGEKGMEAVAAVTINRTQDSRWPPTVCGVVHEQKVKGICQFSWVCDKRLRGGPKLKREAEISAWELAGHIARVALTTNLVSIVGNATHYHATYVHPKWANHLDRIVRIGAHIFYREL